MSAIRRLSAVYRREQRQIRACPYHRSEESLQKEKKASRVRQASFFSSYLPLIPSQWSSYLGYFNIFNIFGSSKVSKKKEEEDANVVVVPEEDVIMTDSEATTTTTEESSSDSSVEIIEVLETVEPVASEEPAKPSVSVECAQPMEPSKPIGQQATSPCSSTPANSKSTLETVPSIPTLSLPSNQPLKPAYVMPSSTIEPPAFTSDEEFLEWVRRKADAHEVMNDMDYLGFKKFMENRRKDLEYVPIKLRFAPRDVSPKAEPSTDTPVSCPPSDRSSASVPSSTGTYWSGFHSSTSLPVFKNNASRHPRPRMLKVNPNGSLLWMGVGSSRNTVEESRKRTAPSALPRLDPYKRRRLFDRRGSSIPLDTTRNIPAPSHASDSDPSVPPTSARTGVNRQHAAPHAPSPLRNVINGPSPFSPRQASTMPTNLNASSSKASRSTYSTTVVQEIVEKAPPRPRYSDVANPYQTTAAIKPLIRPMERRKMSERRARTKELEKQREAARVKETEKKKELSAKEIIEATIPKGAKRSRPPPGLTKSRPFNTAASPVTSKRSLEEPREEESVTKKRRTVTVEEIPDDADARNKSVPMRPNVIIESRSPSPELAARPAPPCAETPPVVEQPGKASSSKGTSGQGATNKEQVTNAVRVKDSIPKVTSVKEVHSKVPSVKELPPKAPAVKESSARSPGTKAATAKGLSNHFPPLPNAKASGKSSVPREPSKLRTSFLPDDYENEEPKVASPTPATTVIMTTPGAPLADIQEKKDPKEVALTLPLNDLPSFIFRTPPTLTAGDHGDARVAAKELPVNVLPKFDFSKARTSTNGIHLPAIPIPTIKPFDFCAAGIKPPTSSRDGQWQCQICMLQNPGSAVEKCSICDSPRPDAEMPKKMTVNGVNGFSGTYAVNGVSGKDTPVKSPMSSSAVKAFDFAAAGLKLNVSVSDGQWTCPACMLQNPPTAAEKCNVCDSTRPGGDKTEKPKKPHINGTARSPSNLTNGVSTPSMKSFDFAAAGVKPRASSSNGTWQCPTCMLQNPATATEKCKICDSPRLEVEEKPVCPSAVPPKPSGPPVVSMSFDWAAAGMLPKVNGNSWTCGTCMLSNPPSATEKCRVCDASRS